MIFNTRIFIYLLFYIEHWHELNLSPYTNHKWEKKSLHSPSGEVLHQILCCTCQVDCSSFDMAVRWLSGNDCAISCRTSFAVNQQGANGRQWPTWSKWKRTRSPVCSPTPYTSSLSELSTHTAWATPAPSLSQSEHKVGLFPAHSKQKNIQFIIHCHNCFHIEFLRCNYSEFSSDVSPTGQGVDHRQVQRELGEVAVQLQEPVTLTSASVRVSWTVSATTQLLLLVLFLSSHNHFLFKFLLCLHVVTFNLWRLTVSLSTSKATAFFTDRVVDPGSYRTSILRLSAALSSAACLKELNMRSRSVHILMNSRARTAGRYWCERLKKVRKQTKKNSRDFIWFFYITYLFAALHFACTLSIPFTVGMNQYVDRFTSLNSPQRSTESCYSGNGETKQLLRCQRLLGASAQWDAKRCHSGVQGKHI